MDQSENAGKKKNSRTHLYIAIIITSIVFIFILLRLFVFNLHSISANSMKPNLKKEDNIVAVKIFWYFGMPARNSLITFRIYQNSEDIYVKRLIGLPGDTVEIAEGKVIINGKQVKQAYATKNSSESIPPVKLGTDEVYLLGDNRANSMDSRSYGPVKTGNITGCAVYRFWPLSRFGGID